VEPGFKRFPANRATWRSAGICGACCPNRCPRAPFQQAASQSTGAL